MEITKQLLVDAIVGKGFIGDAKKRSAEIQLFTELCLAGWDGEPFLSKCSFIPQALERLSIEDLELIYTRSYEQETQQQILIAKVIPQQLKRFN